MSSENVNVFVYGTLRKEGSRAYVLEGSSATFLGVYVTKPQYTLYDLGPFPAIVALGTDTIRGELWDVNSEVLATLDRIEGHPHFYKREWISLAHGSVAYCYFLDIVGLPDQVTRIPGGDYIEYLSKKQKGR